MTMFRHVLILIAFVLAGCVSPTQSPLPAAAAFLPPAGGFLPVTQMPVAHTKGSAWGWRVRTPEGIWKVACRYDGWADEDKFSAVIRFPNGTSLTLPGAAVSVACRAIGREPDLEAWQDPRGRMLLRLSGGITASASEGIFALAGHRLDGWWCRSMIDATPTSERKIDYEGVFDSDGRQVAP